MFDRELKRDRVRELLASKGLDALLLQRVSSFAWYTGGAASYVNTATDFGAAAVLITPRAEYIITNNIEAPRLEHEELLTERGFEIISPRWHGATNPVAELTPKMRLGADLPYTGAIDLTAEVGLLRSRLTAAEGERFRQLGRACAFAMDAAIRQVRPGLTEYQIAALLAKETLDRGALPIVNLIATDERIFNFRHPLPTAKIMKRYAMLILCGRQSGLVTSLTRLVNFGSLPEDLARKQAACAQVDGAFIANTRPGTELGQVFGEGVKAYADTGYPDEWQLHHQGGPAGYEAREQIVTPSAQGTVFEGQAFAWNPSITGVKCEDTILVGAHSNEILTAIAGWPTLEVEVGEQVMARPAILVVD